jgi:hypothetical protein
MLQVSAVALGRLVICDLNGLLVVIYVELRLKDGNDALGVVQLGITPQNGFSF